MEEVWTWKKAQITPGMLTNKFIIVMPIYNAEESIENAVLSVLNQDFNDIGIIIRNDISTDKSGDVIRKIFEMEDVKGDFHIKNKERNVVYIENQKKLYSGGNIHDSVMQFVADPYAIIGQVDGDDYLMVPDAVSIVYKAYEDNPEKWFIWTQHVSRVMAAKNHVGYSLPLPPDKIIYATRSYWGMSHFRTFLAALLHKIEPLDLCDPYNPFKYAKICGDASMLYAMAEMCGNTHSLFIDRPLYYYNDGGPTNDSKRFADELAYYKWFFETKQRYAPLEEL